MESVRNDDFEFDEEDEPTENNENSDEIGFERKVKSDIDMFSYKTVDLPGIPKQEKIKKFIVSQETNILVTESNHIYRWRKKKEPSFVQCELPDPRGDNIMGLLVRGKDKQTTIANVHLDQKGYHCIISTDSRQHCYFNYRDTKVRNLPKIKNLNIRCMNFYNPENELSTGEIVIASDNGAVSLYRIDIREEIIETINPSVVQLPTTSDIQNIEIYRLQQNPNVGGKYLITIFATNNSLFCMTGPDDIGLLFKRFEDRNQRIKEVPMPRGYSSMGHTCYSKYTKRPTNYLWTNGNTLLSFRIPEKHEKINDNFLTRSEAYKYAKKVDLDDRNAYVVQEIPLNIGVTDFHYYLLHQDTFTIMSRITQKIVKIIEFKGSSFVDMTYQRNTNTYWIYSATTVTKLDTSKQDTDVWKLLIEKKKFKEAYQVAKITNENLDYVAGLYADSLFDLKEYQLAASLYIDTARTFEQIFIRFLTVDNNPSRQGLEMYIKSWLKKILPDEKSQRCLLVGWLIELLVYKLNNLERQLKTTPKNATELRSSIEKNEDELDRLLTDNVQVLDQNLVYSIMQYHGRINNIVKFAERKNNFQMIILHHINEQDFKTAISNLKRVKDKKVVEVVYKYSHIFFREVIEDTVDLLMKSIQDFKPVKLIAGFMNIPVEKRSYGIELLRYCIIELKCRDKSIHNILIFFYATAKKEKDELLNLIKSGKLNFDVEFALRLFKRHHMYEAEILVYGVMNLYSEAVNLSLQNGKFALAKSYANMPEDDDVKKKLWLEIAINLLRHGRNVNEVINLTKESKVIKIEDLLPHFNEKIKIEDFKDEICDSLKGYSQQIERLKKQMESYSSNAEQLKNQLRTIKNRCVEIDSSNKCQQCLKSLFNEEFYIFPCMHGFHRDCLLSAVKLQPTTERQKIQRIEACNKQLDQMRQKILLKKKANTKEPSNSFLSNAWSLFGGNKKSQQDDIMLSLNKEQQEIKAKKEQFDELLAAECIYCGPSIVDTITMPFDDTTIKASWKI